MIMKHKSIIALFALGAFIATAASGYQLFDMTDYSTGFFKMQFQKSGWMVTLFIGVVIACIGLVAAQSRRNPRRSKKTTPVFIAVSAVYAVFGIYEVFANDFARLLSPAVSSVVLILGVLSSLSVVGISLPVGEYRGVLAFVTLCYSLLRLVLPFSRYTKMPSTAQNVYELAFLCLQLLFWLYAAMMFNSVSKKRAVAHLLPLSLMLAAVCSVIAVPQFVAFFAVPEAVHSGTVEPLFLIGAGVYSAYFSLELYNIKRIYPKGFTENKDSKDYYIGDN